MDTEDVAIWKNLFFKQHFSVDQCLSEFTQKSDLETLRKDLKNYGTELQLQMSEILKNETEAIVNLAEYLTNLNSKIDNLAIPISQLREEIKNLYELIKGVEQSYDTMLAEIKKNTLKQNHIHLKQGIISSCVYVNFVISTIEKDWYNNLNTLERIVNKYSFQKIYLCELSLMTTDIESITTNIEEKLVKNINMCFLNAFKDKYKTGILKCLRMYINLQKQDEAHKTIQINILRPQLQPLFTDKYLEKNGQSLDQIYMKVRFILDSEIDYISRIIEEYSDLNSFNFVLNSFWPEFDMQSTNGLPYITAPGNPELFQKRFISTFNLLKYIAERSGDKTLVSKNVTFLRNLKRFNLPVYFEIKFQQIAGNFESENLNLSLQNIYLGNNELSLTLKPTISLIKSLETCFQGNVYIDQLADQFIKLSLMLISRYLKLIDNVLNNSITVDTPKEEVDNFIINCLFDLNAVEALVGPKCDNISSVDQTIFSITNKNIWHIILKVFKENSKTIDSCRVMLQNYVINLKVKECTTQLQSVTAIPRLYRRTNRSPPKEASLYIVNTVKPILDFNNAFKDKLGQQLNQILDNILLQITTQYLSLVQEVLLSVCKTEESLKRLKSRTLNTSADKATSKSDMMSDETKIRVQIKYDVTYFYDNFYQLALPAGQQALLSLKGEVYNQCI
ncbi:hypothetical protein GWI33_019629 [Rhynchophorus ferrugineus]|uniref:Conserved oligomeric Golgi complex subunit 2 n=1 Tax=Rhynchophorus ferrugineus TaxID=354439 RepID=A0A834HR41_RHYFE|nr:hypothetical protein GWI33_019629 [Rhynchophorus ferrugineus]